MASTSAAVPFWRSAGITYVAYSNVCANLLRNCLKEPHKSEALTREKVHFSRSKRTDGKPQKPGKTFLSYPSLSFSFLFLFIFLNLIFIVYIFNLFHNIKLCIIDEMKVWCRKILNIVFNSKGLCLVL